MQRGHVRSIIQIIPVLCMVLVAVIQMALVATKELSPWRMGGFGMFSAIDGETNRFIEVYALVGGAWEAVPMVGYERHALRTRALPTEAAFQRLLVTIACDSEMRSRGAQAVRLAYYVAHYERAAARMVPVLRRTEQVNGCAE